MLCSPIAAPRKGETLVFTPSYFLKPLSLLWQATRPDAFPHPHRLPAEGSRLGTNRPCSQVSASPTLITLWQVTRAENTLCQQSIFPPPSGEVASHEQLEDAINLKQFLFLRIPPYVIIQVIIADGYLHKRSLPKIAHNARLLELTRRRAFFM